MSEPTISDLERIANRLTGKRVIIRRRLPVLHGALGLAMQDRKGKFYIDISPSLAGDDLLRVFAHECAHIVRGDPPPSNWPHEPSGCIQSRAVIAYTAALPRETKTDQLAAGWVQYAQDNAPSWGDPWQALDRWQDPALQAIIDRAVKAGVALALARLERR